MKNITLVAILFTLPLGWSCAAFTGQASPWMMDKLKVQAAFDLQCTEDKVTTTETGTWTYGVRGCEKQAVYVMRACNQLSHQCTFLRNGEIVRLDPPAAPAPAPDAK